MKRCFLTAVIRRLFHPDTVPALSSWQTTHVRSIQGRRGHEGARQSLIFGIISVIAVAALALLTGAADAQAKTEIQFWHAMEGPLGETVDELVKQFNQSQGEFEVKAVYKGTYPQTQAAAMAAYRQKNPPHVVQVFDVGTLSMLLSDTIIPAYRLMKQQQVEIDWADFIETVIGYYSKDDRLPSMPFNVSTPILYYNKDTFRKAGLGDKAPATWQDVETASRKILASGTATCGFSTTGASWTMLENMFPWHDQPFATNQNGYTGLDTRLLINSDFGRMHIGALARWHKENIFSYGGPGGVDPKFINGDCAMFVQSSAFIGGFKSSLKFDWGTGQLPHWGPPYAKENTNIGGASLWVMRGREPADYKGVAQFLKFITEPSQQMWLAGTTGWVPITRTAVRNLDDDDFYKKNPEQWAAMTQLLSAKLNAKPTWKSRGLRLGNYAQIREAIEQELVNIFNGKMTVKEGLDAAVLRGNAILREFKVINGAAPQGEI
jgi:sn-glycerol 3-phosphate transport system substrate-binding protein